MHYIYQKVAPRVNEQGYAMELISHYASVIMIVSQEANNNLNFSLNQTFNNKHTQVFVIKAHSNTLYYWSLWPNTLMFAAAKYMWN